MSSNDFFPLGATYAPLAKATEVDPEQWPADIERMKKLGLNTFRLFICWDRIEQKRGERDFSLVDYAFDLAHKNGIKVLANVGGTFANLQAIYPPRWLVYEAGCALLKPEPEATEELHFNRFKLCYDDPTYQKEAKNFLQEAIARYKDHPALLAWSGWNEPRVSECFCKHSVAEYRKWLQNKYDNDLEKLAKTWSTEFPLYFRTWDDVFPQPQANFEAGGYKPFLDWKAFLEYNRTEKFHMVRDWIKEVDPKTNVISHMCGPYHADIFGKEDILGTSIYTIHAQRKMGEFEPYEFTYRQNVQFMTEGLRDNREDPEGFWVVETEAGPVTWVHNLEPRSYSPRKLNAKDMYYVANGARAILRWLYRSRVTDAQAGEFNLVGWDGRITERADEFGKMSQFIDNNKDTLLHHTPENKDIIILDTRDCDSLSDCEGYGYRYSDSLHFLHNALLHVGVRGRMCNSRQIMEGILDNAKILFVTFHPHVSQEMGDIFRKFVENGGTIVAESPFAIKDMDGIHYEATPGNLIDVFGAQVYDMEKLDEPCCGSIPAYDFRAKMEVKGGTIEARFANGDPAIISNKFGKGNTVLYGSLLAAAYQISKPFYPETANKKVITYSEGEAFRNELRKRLELADVAPVWKLSDINPDDSKNVQVVFRKVPDGRRLLFVLNMDDKPNKFSLSFDGYEKAEELGSSESSKTFAVEAGKLSFSLDEWGWSVLTI